MGTVSRSNPWCAFPAAVLKCPERPWHLAGVRGKDYLKVMQGPAREGGYGVGGG